ncbi:R-SNARE [Pavlovales sp. CCMP2436]|nr:R-SNARE [Pavlovales sp. CCMP2436]
MPKLTIIARVVDGLPLAASMEDDKYHRDLDVYKNQAKRIFKQLTNSSPGRLSIETGSEIFHYLIEGGVCYLVLTERAYPKRLAFNYLEELQKEFNLLYATEVDSATRPYAFIKFDTFIQKTKKLYMDTRAQRNVNKLNEDLADVQKIMMTNIQEVLGRGERLDSVARHSGKLRDGAREYARQAKYLNTQMLLRKYGPVVLVVGIVLLMLYWRFR